jgi:hypothetical protein
VDWLAANNKKLMPQQDQLHVALQAGSMALWFQFDDDEPYEVEADPSGAYDLAVLTPSSQSPARLMLNGKAGLVSPDGCTKFGRADLKFRFPQRYGATQDTAIRVTLRAPAGECHLNPEKASVHSLPRTWACSDGTTSCSRAVHVMLHTQHISSGSSAPHNMSSVPHNLVCALCCVA